MEQVYYVYIHAPMTKYLCFILFIAGCSHRPPKNTQAVTLFSKPLNDSLSIFISLPDGYDTAMQHYPVAYLLDANLYFDIMATVIHKYAEVGLAPQVIVAGIGYKDFPTMDSLRNRDYTYPVAIPEYEMSTSGGADNFLSFIDSELTPYIDNTYRTDTSRRILMGHSLGGYFTMYALSEYLAGKNNTFTGYIAASPSLHYNRYYLLDQLEKTKPVNNRRAIKSYISYGSLEEDTSALKLADLTTRLSKCLPDSLVKHQVDIYTNLDHMDTQLPTFIKGLQWMSE
jgi:uncharacterized protein